MYLQDWLQCRVVCYFSPIHVLITVLVHRLEAVYNSHMCCGCRMCPSPLQTCLGESFIWKMTRANNLSICADWGAQLTFSTIAELQLSVHWPNPIESPYGQSNVIFQAFILCLQLHWEGPWRDCIWNGQEQVSEQPLSKGGREIMYRTGMVTGLNVKYGRQGTGHTEVKWFYMAWSIDLCFSSKGHLGLELVNRGNLLLLTYPVYLLGMLPLKLRDVKSQR